MGGGEVATRRGVEVEEEYEWGRWGEEGATMKAREAGAQSAATTARERNIMVLRLGVDPAFCEDVDFYGFTENLE
jgi:hypothetical protein